MFALDVPLDVAAHYAPIVIAQASGVDRTIGACAPIENSDAARGTAAQILDPSLTARSYMRRVENRAIDAGGKITVQKGPTHGSLKDLGRGAWQYSPAEGYFGADRATRVRIAVKSWEVRARYLQADAVALEKHVARDARVHRDPVDLALLGRFGSLERVAVP